MKGMVAECHVMKGMMLNLSEEKKIFTGSSSQFLLMLLISIDCKHYSS